MIISGLSSYIIQKFLIVSDISAEEQHVDSVWAVINITIVEIVVNFIIQDDSPPALHNQQVLEVTPHLITAGQLVQRHAIDVVVSIVYTHKIKLRSSVA
jgi:hypothetical protein